MTGPTSTHKAYLRVAIWLALLATVVLIPGYPEAAGLSDSDKTINTVVTAG